MEGKEMETVVIRKTGRDMYHGTRNEVGGSGGTSDNGWSYKMAIASTVNRYIKPGEQYRLEVNGKDKGIFTR